MKATAYCSGTTTASGKPVKYGMCAGKKEWLGCVAVVYERNKYGLIGKHIGTYDVEDTGGKAIRNGKVIDIYIPSYEDCRKFGVKDVYVQIIKGEG